MVDSPDAAGRRVVILNPVSGTEDHEQQVRQLASEHGFDVVETSPDGGAVAVAERLAGRAEVVAAAGGDGTINEVVRGLRDADALGETTLGVVPAGTGNNFAEKIGVESISHAFEVLREGDRRRIDLGVVEDRTGSETATRPFVNSCVCGVTAEASSSTDPDQKSRLGTLAYLINTLREVQAFDPIPLSVRTAEAVDAHWEGEAIAVLVGNGRRFPAEGDGQANMEDGLFEVTILEAVPALDLVGEEARRRLLAADADHLIRLRTPGLDLRVDRDESQSFSLDGEMLDAREVRVEVDPGRVELCVGETYDPAPRA